MTEEKIREIVAAFEEEYTEGTIEEFKIWPREFDMGDGKKPCTVMIELASKYDHTDERYKKWACGLLFGTDKAIESLKERLTAESVAGGVAGHHKQFIEFYIPNFEKEG